MPATARVKVMNRAKLLLFAVVAWSCCIVGFSYAPGWFSPEAKLDNKEQFRKLLYGEEGALDKGTCKNTVQGRVQITDDHGVLCQRTDLDYQTGCCKTGTKFACDKCTLHDKCCTEYESCVSCCLNPKFEAASLAKTSLRALGKKDAGFWGTEWEYCAGKCRTHGRSLTHENAYISGRHHCFSALGKPMLSIPLPSGALDGVEVVLSNTAESCEAACRRLGQRQCSESHLTVLNNCDQLREQVGCEAGCVQEQGKQHYPGYIEPHAPKAQRPALCLTANPAVFNPSCTAHEQFVKRLCPCRTR